jgi:hypothetical protein
MQQTPHQGLTHIWCTIQNFVAVYVTTVNIHPWQYKQPQKTEGYVPQNEDDFLQ